MYIFLSVEIFISLMHINKNFNSIKKFNQYLIGENAETCGLLN